ncbi:DUF2726 domain-containing protein [Prosthecobacter sp.]|uniref:DUF2726 domain-containing protein n=1 Tax=Prosthecobacter sp. TaxID=1965333 RepID=UPI0037851F79
MQSSPATTPLSPPEKSPHPSALLTSAEALFYACLDNLTAQRCHIQCKPRLSEILQDENVAGFLKICQRHIDFVISRKEDWLPMVAIEFEDDSPGKSGRKPRDRQLVNDIFLTVGIPLLQVHSKEINQIETLLHKLSAAWTQRMATLETQPAPAPEPPPPPPPTTALKGGTPSSTRPMLSTSGPRQEPTTTPTSRLTTAACTSIS